MEHYMTSPYEQRVGGLQERLREARLDGALITDPDSIFWLSGYWGYASLVSCGRPNIMWVPASDEPEIITPSMELEMCRNLTPFPRIRHWIDGENGEWRAHLIQLLERCLPKGIGLDKARMPGIVLDFLLESSAGIEFHDVGPIIGSMRIVKSTEEIETMRKAGQVALAMVEAGRESIRVGIPEYEISLAAMSAGTRMAAELLGAAGGEWFDSPMIHNLQIMQSGSHTCMVHRRPTVRRIEHGDPVYLCFCGITVFKGYWLGFDREFFVGRATAEQARLYELTIEAQMAALNSVRPGAIAEDVHHAANEVYQSAGFPPTYRTGRGTGASILEMPELKTGDKTVLRPGMTFAVDGGLTVPGQFGARVGDSIVVTSNGFDYLTPYPKALTII
jgi:Xaa-Pro dipeptidase